MRADFKKYWPILVIIIGSVLLWSYLVWLLADDYYAAFISEDPYTEERYNIFSNLYYGISPLWGLLAVVPFLLCIKLFSFRTTAGKAWLLLTVSMVLWFLGDFFYSFVWFVFHTEDLPSIHFGRVCYIIGYFAILLGMALQLKAGGMKLEKREVEAIAITEGAFLAVSLFLCVIPLIALPVDGVYIVEELDKWILIFYLIFDEVNVVLAILLIFKYRGGQFSKGWLVIAAGFMAEAAYDMIYSYMYYILQLDNSWYVFEPIYYIVYVLLAVGAVYLFIATRSAHA
nr:hypothetical protein [Candidatus Sigynarchaeota archaeon]